MITEATIRNARYYPELLPDTRIATVSAGSELSPPIVNLRRFSPKFLHLVNISISRVDATLRLRSDGLRQEIPASVLPDQSPAPWEIIGTELLEFNLYSSTGVSNVPVSYGLWVYEPTVAHKIKHGKPLTGDETKIASDLGIHQSVEKGVLPLPLSYVVEREYQVVEEISRGVVVDVGTEESVVDVVMSRPNEVLVLTEIAAYPGTAANNIRIRIDRDTDSNYLELNTLAMSLDRSIKCFVPALHEFRFKVIANSLVSGFAARFTVRRCVLTNILKARFRLAGPNEIPGDTWNKVWGGVL